jgi:hypothetical protein
VVKRHFRRIAPEPGEQQEATTPKRRRRARAHVSHAGFAALATVSIAAVTVIAASGGGDSRAGIEAAYQCE